MSNPLAGTASLEKLKLANSPVWGKFIPNPMNACTQCGADVREPEGSACESCAVTPGGSGLAVSAVFLSGCMLTVVSAIVGLARADFWEAAPTLLHRYMNP